MGNFFTTGYFVFAFIMIFNIQFIYFGQGTSDTLNTQIDNGLESNGTININNLEPSQISPSPLLTSDTTLKPNTTDSISKDLYPDIISLISNLFFAFAEAVEKSGIPNPLAFIFALIIKIFTGTYLFYTALNIKNWLLGGGTTVP